MTKIQKISTYLTHFLTIIMVLLPVILFFQWIFIDIPMVKNMLKSNFIQNFFYNANSIVSFDTVQWTPAAKMIGFMGDAVSWSPLFFSLFVLKPLFERYRLGDIFSIKNARSYRCLGQLFFLDALVSKPISDVLLSLAPTFENGPGARVISIGFGTSNIESLFCGFFIITISWIMIEASQLNTDQNLTI